MHISVNITFDADEEKDIPDRCQEEFAKEMQESIISQIRHWHHVGDINALRLEMKMGALLNIDDPPPKNHPGMGNDGPDEDSISKN